MTSFNFYQVVDEYGGSYTASTDQEFYSSIESVIMDRKLPLEYGYIKEYVFIDGHTSVPIHTRNFEVSTIEFYELNEYLEDRPEMNEKNYLAYTIEEDNEEDMLTLIEITRG